MKSLMFSICILLLAAVAFAQEDPTEGSAIGECYYGELVNGTGNITVIPCDFTVDSCQTKIESKVGFTKVVRECKQTEACEENASGNVPKCYPGENNVRQCFFCCNTPLCNDSLEIPEQTEE